MSFYDYYSFINKGYKKTSIVTYVWLIPNSMDSFDNFFRKGPPHNTTPIPSLGYLKCY